MLYSPRAPLRHLPLSRPFLPRSLPPSVPPRFPRCFLAQTGSECGYPDTPQYAVFQRVNSLLFSQYIVFMRFSPSSPPRPQLSVPLSHRSCWLGGTKLACGHSDKTQYVHSFCYFLLYKASTTFSTRGSGVNLLSACSTGLV